MKVMTFNLRTDFILDINNRWANRSNIVYEVIEKYNCDIIGVQELTNKMFEDMSKNLKDYNIIGSPRTKKLFLERNDILVLKKHEILDYETFWLSEKPNKIWPKAREYGLKKTEEHIESKDEEDNLPVILMGDFNATPKSKEIRDFICIR